MSFCEQEWRLEQLRYAEKHWESTLSALGVDRVREVLSKEINNDTVAFGHPYKTKKPDTGRPYEFNPTKEFVVQWLSRKSELERVKTEKSSERALKMQWIALGISFLGTCAVIANTVRAYFE